MAAPPEMLNSTLTAEEVKRWRFNKMMDFNAKPSQPATLIAQYEPLIKEAKALADEYNAAAAALPRAYAYKSQEEGDKIRREHERIRTRAAQQSRHAYDLRVRYSRELAYSIWWFKVDEYNAACQARSEAYAAACEAHRAEQRAFAEAQADEAIAAMPPLSDAIKARLRILIRIAVNQASRYKENGDYYVRPRDGLKRRVMRGVPLVEVGELPHPQLPPALYLNYDLSHAF